MTDERVGEGKVGGELFGFDQKTCAVGDPWIDGFHERLNSVLSSQLSVVSFLVLSFQFR